jgi:hypothetical protein
VITLNEVALAALLETQDGPVGRHVERMAQRVVVAMQTDVKGYFRGADFGIENDVALRMDGSTAIVGLRDDPEGRSTHAESKSRRYARLGKWEQARQTVGQ